MYIPTSVATDVFDVIMGNPTQFRLGLVDAQDSLYLDSMLTQLQKVWNGQEKPYNCPPVFSHGLCSIRGMLLLIQRHDKFALKLG